MTFHVSLIKIRYANADARRFVTTNCMEITDDYHFYEGDMELFDDVAAQSRFDFEVMSQGIVSSLGGLSKKELIIIALENFNMGIGDRELLESIQETL